MDLKRIPFVSVEQLMNMAVNCENLGQPLGNAVRDELLRRIEHDKNNYHPDLTK